MQHQTVKKIGSGAAVAAIGLLVGGATAEAATRPDDRAMRGPGAVALTNAWVAAGNVARPDDRPTHGPGANAAARRDVVLRPDDRADRSLPSGAPVAPPSGGDGFDWVDAGVGSAATLGLVLLVAGASVVRLRQGAPAA